MEDYFSLPAGQYTVVHYNNYSEVGDHHYEPQFPPHQRIKKFNFKRIVLRENYPNIASIVYPIGIIILEKNILDSPLPVIEAIINHEKGHIYYEDESLCDTYSSEIMKQKGYNASQIYAAFKNTLFSNFRKKHIYNHLKNYSLCCQ